MGKSCHIFWKNLPLPLTISQLCGFVELSSSVPPSPLATGTRQSDAPHVVPLVGLEGRAALVRRAHHQRVTEGSQRCPGTAQAKKMDHKCWQPHKLTSGSEKMENHTQEPRDKPHLTQRSPGANKEELWRQAVPYPHGAITETSPFA